MDLERSQITLIAVILLLASIGLMRPFFRRSPLREPNVVVVMYLLHIAAQVAPAFSFLNSPDRPAAHTYFVAAAVVAPIIPIGAYIADFLVAVPQRRRHRYFVEPLDEAPELRSATKRLLILAALACGALFALYVVRAPSVPIATLLQPDTDPRQFKELRASASPSETGYIFGVGRTFLMPLLFLLILSSWSWLRTTRIGPLRVPLLAMAILYGAYTGAKTPVTQLFVLGLLLWMIRRQRLGSSARSTSLPRWRKRAVGAIAIFGMVGYPLLIFSYLPLGQNNTIETVFVEGVVKRLTERPAENTYAAFEIFPSDQPFTGFADVQRLSAVMGWEPINLSYVVAQHRKGFAVSSPPATIGAFWAEAGWPAVTLGYLVAASVMRAMENVIVRQRRKTYVHDVLLAIVLYGAFRLAWSDFTGVLLSEAVVPGLLTLGLWRVVRSFGRRPRTPGMPSTPRSLAHANGR